MKEGIVSCRLQIIAKPEVLNPGDSEAVIVIHGVARKYNPQTDSDDFFPTYGFKWIGSEPDKPRTQEDRQGMLTDRYSDKAGRCMQCTLFTRSDMLCGIKKASRCVAYEPKKTS